MGRRPAAARPDQSISGYPVGLDAVWWRSRDQPVDWIHACPDNAAGLAAERRARTAAHIPVIAARVRGPSRSKAIISATATSATVSASGEKSFFNPGISGPALS